MSTDRRRWWIAPPGQQPEGPFSILEIRSHVESSPAGTEWQVCEEGSDKWQPLTDLPGFTPPRVQGTAADQGVSATSKINNYLMWMHLSQFANIVVPLAGIVIPIILWLGRKDDDELIDRQGREITNWIIFCLTVYVAVLILVFLVPLFLLAMNVAFMPLAGCLVLPFFLAVSIMQIIFPILGAIRGSKGEFYRYPMFFRIIS